MRILHVEDDLGLARAQKGLFLDYGYEYDHAANLAAAQDKVASFRPDVILSDGHFPTGG
jgi:DNA-binding response OmpR family regulator